MRHPLRLVIAILGLLYTLSLSHGLPHRFVPDDTAVKCALHIAADLADGESPLPLIQRAVPPAGSYTTYPYLLPYLDLVAIGVRYAAGRLVGEWSSAAAFREVLFEDASLAWLPARWVTVLLALLLPLALSRATRELGRGRVEAALAALLGGSSLLVVQYVHTSRPWAPLVALVALTLAASLRLRRRGGRQDVALAFVCAGLAAAVHPAGLVAFGLPVLAGMIYRLPFSKLLLGASAGGLICALVGYPYLLVYGRDAAVGALMSPSVAGSIQLGGQAFSFDLLGGGQAATVIYSWIGYDPVLLCLGFGAFFGFRKTWGKSWWLVAFPCIAWTALFLSYDGAHVRYFIPAVPFLAIGAGPALAFLMRGGKASQILALGLLAFPLVQAARLDQLMGRLDTRTEAAVAIESLSSSRDVIAVDHQGSYYAPPLQSTSASLEKIESFVPLTSSERRHLSQVATGVAEDSPWARHLVPVSRFWVFDSYYPSDYILAETGLDLGSFFREHGVTMYVQIDRFPDEQRRQPVTDLLAERGELIYALSPTGSHPPSTAALPTDLAFPLVDLWKAFRPGPWVRVWKLN